MSCWRTRYRSPPELIPDILRTLWYPGPRYWLETGSSLCILGKPKPSPHLVHKYLRKTNKTKASGPESDLSDILNSHDIWAPVTCSHSTEQNVVTTEEKSQNSFVHVEKRGSHYSAFVIFSFESGFCSWFWTNGDLPDSPSGIVLQPEPA